MSPAGSRERKCGTGLWCVAAAALAGEDDVDIGGCVLELLHALVGVGHLLLHGGGVAHVLLPPQRWWGIVIIRRMSQVDPTSNYVRKRPKSSFNHCVCHNIKHSNNIQ